MATQIDSVTACSLAPPRPPDAHKGTFGHLFVVGGARGFTGAVKLACAGALRSGAGLVTAGVPRPLGDVFAADTVEAMSYLLPATAAESVAHAAVEPALAFAVSKEAVALGPGLSRDPDTAAFVREFVPRCPVPLLIDADGLNCLSSDPGLLRTGPAPRVVTPHPGEMARLTGTRTADIQRGREAVARRFAADYGCVVVLKGHRTLIAAPAALPGMDDAYENPTGNSGLATGGTGDVLTGVIGGLMAQGLDGFRAAILGVYLHGLAGDLAAAAHTARAMVASDVVDALGGAWAALERSE